MLMKRELLDFKQLIGHGYGDFVNTKKRYRVCKGSRGSKKSKTTALDIIRKLKKYPCIPYSGSKKNSRITSRAEVVML